MLLNSNSPGRLQARRAVHAVMAVNRFAAAGERRAANAAAAGEVSPIARHQSEPLPLRGNRPMI